MTATTVLLADLVEIHAELRRLRDTGRLTAEESHAAAELLAEIDEIPAYMVTSGGAFDDIARLTSAATRLKLAIEARSN